MSNSHQQEVEQILDPAEEEMTEMTEMTEMMEMKTVESDAVLPISPTSRPIHMQCI